MRSRKLGIWILVASLASPAFADTASDGDVPWYRGTHGKNRITHLSITVGLNGAALAGAF